MVTAQHPWLLVAPWYQWSDPYDPMAGRLSNPSIQKFESSNFVADFIRDPQHSLKYVDPDDFIQRPTKSNGTYVLSKTTVRKIYLETHKRFYLVVCQLNCDLPGFPNSSRDEVCEAGFVVRRRIAKIPKAATKEATKAVQQIALNRIQLAQINELPPGMKIGATKGLRAKVAAGYTAAQAELVSVATEYGITTKLEGWAPDEFEGIGSWQTVEETPEQIAEQIYPLYPVIPDPGIEDFSGGQGTLYFGVLPASSADVDEKGNSKFDDRMLYEARCFVRRHDPNCPKTRERNDCKGELVWSKRTESYQLANQFDLSGTSNRPVNVFLPDLPALEAQAAQLKPGQGAPVRMISPSDSNLEVSVPNDDLSGISKKGASAAICCFSIPLITIVATFVLKIFLPVVMLLFGLWFLLKLKFCIPPSLSLQGDVAVELDVALGGIEVGLDVDVAIDAGLFTDLKGLIEPGSGKTLGSLENQAGDPFGKLDVAQMAGNGGFDFSASAPESIEIDPAPSDTVPRELPSATSGLEYEDRVEVKS